METKRHGLSTDILCRRRVAVSQLFISLRGCIKRVPTYYMNKYNLNIFYLYIIVYISISSLIARIIAAMYCFFKSKNIIIKKINYKKNKNKKRL